MSTFTEKHLNDWKLQIEPIKKQVRQQLPTLADAFDKRIAEELERPFGMGLEKLEAIRASGRYTPEGEHKERRLAVHGFVEEKLPAVRAATVGALAAQRQEKRAALLKPKNAPTDPSLLLVRELRHRELRDHLRKLDPLVLHTRVQQDDGTSDLLDALEGAPAGFPIAPAELIQVRRTQLAEANHPELGELAMLQQAYEFVLGVTENTILAASGLTKREVATVA